MAYRIGDECIGCGACAADCPTSCIVDAVVSSKSTRQTASNAALAQEAVL